METASLMTIDETVERVCDLKFSFLAYCILVCIFF